MTPYTGKAYLYIEDGEIVANAELKPRSPNPAAYCESERNLFLKDCSEYKPDIAKWESNNIEVKNGGKSESMNYDIVLIVSGLVVYANIAQPCHIDNGIVTELLT